MIKNKAVFVKFGLVGILNTLIDIMMFAILINVGTHYIIAQVVSYCCGLINSYLFNKKWTFKSTIKINLREIGKFIAVNLITFLITIGLLYLFEQNTEYDLITIKLFATAIGMVVNFMGSKLWVFVEIKKIDLSE
jgi:putative flippase GtrA